MDPIYHFAPNPFPAHLREELPYPSAPWLVSRELFKRLAAAPEVNSAYKKIELRSDDPEAMFVQKYYEHNPPPGKGIRRIYVIHSGNQTEGFEAELRKCELEAPKFQPNWSRESEAEHRDEVYAEWQVIADQFIPLEIATSKRIYRIIHARVLPLWHGTSQNKASSICESGFTFFGNDDFLDPQANEREFANTDPGYFGKGIYFTDSPSYAGKYSSENILMLAFVAMRTPFPIVANAPHPARCLDMMRFNGQPLHLKYNAHFIPVAPITPGSMQYYPCQFEEPECNEYVIKMPSQTLARYQVEIGDGFPLFQAMITQGKNNLPLLKKGKANEVNSEVLIEKLCDHYTSICTDLPLPMSEATFPLKELFTQLVILESKLVEQKEKEAEKKEKDNNSSRDSNLPERDSLAEAMAHLQETTTPIAIEDLFTKKESTKEPKKVLLIGRAGIGKTTLIDRITLGWTEGEMFPQFDAVFRLVLRELNDFQEEKEGLQWLAAAIADAIYQDSDQFHDVLAYIQQNQSCILILLDGLDEANKVLLQKVKRLLQIPELHILISSRPGVPAAIKNRTDRQIENTGFSNTQMEEYTAKFFAQVSSDPNQTTPFLNAIRSNQNLFSLAHTPLQLQMLCTLWETGAKDKGFGSSLTVLYTEMFKQLYLWHVCKQNPYADTSDLSIDERLIEGLGKVALAGLEARQLMLSEATLKDALHGTGVTIAQLRATGLLKKSGKHYTFFHLTFQEYLIAYYMSLLSSKEQWDFIRANRYKPHYRLVMSFLAGHIYQSDRRQDKAKTKHFFETLFSSGADLAGYMQLELTLRCASECPSLYDWMNDQFGIEEALRELLALCVENYGEYYGNNILENLSQLCIFRKIDSNHDCLTDDLKQMLNNQDYNFKRVLQVILKLSSKINIDDEMLNKIIEFLADRDRNLRYAAFEALEEIGNDERLNDEIIPKILEVLDDSDAGTAVERLRRNITANRSIHKTIGRKQSNNNIPNIAEGLVDGNGKVKKAMTKLFEKTGIRAELDQTDTFQIVELLADRDSSVRYEAAQVLGEIGANKLDEEILFKIAEFLVNSDYTVRRAAIEALGKIGLSHIPHETIIPKIAELITDSDAGVRKVAVNVLGKIGSNGQINQNIVFKIAEFLSDNDKWVQYAAVEEIGKIGERFKINAEIISKIAVFLDESNDTYVLKHALNVLEKIGTRNRLGKKLISRIAKLLSGSEDLCMTVLAVLGKIGAREDLDEEIIYNIAEFLSNRDKDIQRAANKSLGRIGTRRNLDEHIISKIIECFYGDSKFWIQALEKTKEPSYLYILVMTMRIAAMEALQKIGANGNLSEIMVARIAELSYRGAEFIIPNEALETMRTNTEFDEKIVNKITKLIVKDNSDSDHNSNETSESDSDHDLNDNHDWGVRHDAANVLRKIRLSCFVKHNLVNASALLDQTFLRQAVLYLEECENKVYLVIRENEEEIRIHLSKSEDFIEIANQSAFAGSFVSRYSNNKHFNDLSFFNEKKTGNKKGKTTRKKAKRKNNCSVQ